VIHCDDHGSSIRAKESMKASPREFTHTLSFFLSLMSFNNIIGIAEDPLRADQSAVGTVNRPLLLYQSSVDEWDPGDRKGRPYISASHEV
jgi:hypothetical protein